MNTGLINKDKRSPNLQLVYVTNSEATKTISKGAPCYYELDGTDDGLNVKSPSSGSDLLSHMFFAGVPAAKDLIAGAGDSIVAYGFVPALKITRATRAASTDSWSSSQSISAGVALTIDTVNDAWVTGGDTLAKRRAAAGASIPSMAASASSTADSRTVITTSVKGFVFAM